VDRRLLAKNEEGGIEFTICKHYDKEFKAKVAIERRSRKRRRFRSWQHSMGCILISLHSGKSSFKRMHRSYLREPRRIKRRKQHSTKKRSSIRRLRNFR
jgi:hypothetical protein